MNQCLISRAQVQINPYGKAKKMAEDLIKDFAATADLSVMILRYSTFTSSFEAVFQDLGLFL